MLSLGSFLFPYTQLTGSLLTEPQSLSSLLIKLHFFYR